LNDRLDYEPLPLAESLAQARLMLARLQGEQPDFPEAGEGACDDCKDEGALYEYGRLKLCRRDARLRHAVAMRQAA
jgi:hypothetical protein